MHMKTNTWMPSHSSICAKFWGAQHAAQLWEPHLIKNVHDLHAQQSQQSVRDAHRRLQFSRAKLLLENSHTEP